MASNKNNKRDRNGRRQSPDIQSQTTVDLSVAQINVEENLKAIAKINESLQQSAKDYELSLISSLTEVSKFFRSEISKTFSMMDDKSSRMHRELYIAATEISEFADEQFNRSNRNSKKATVVDSESDKRDATDPRDTARQKYQEQFNSMSKGLFGNIHRDLDKMTQSLKENNRIASQFINELSYYSGRKLDDNETRFVSEAERELRAIAEEIVEGRDKIDLEKYKSKRYADAEVDKWSTNDNTDKLRIDTEAKRDIAQYTLDAIKTKMYDYGPRDTLSPEESDKYDKLEAAAKEQISKIQESNKILDDIKNRDDSNKLNAAFFNKMSEDASKKLGTFVFDSVTKIGNSIIDGLEKVLDKMYQRWKTGIETISGTYESTYSSVSVLMNQNQEQYMKWQTSAMEQIDNMGLHNNVAISEVMSKLEETTKLGITGYQAQNKALADAVGSKIAPFLDVNNEAYIWMQLNDKKMANIVLGLGNALNENVGQSRYMAKNLNSILGEMQPLVESGYAEEFDQTFASTMSQLEAIAMNYGQSLTDDIKTQMMSMMDNPYERATSGSPTEARIFNIVQENGWSFANSEQLLKATLQANAEMARNGVGVSEVGKAAIDSTLGTAGNWYAQDNIIKAYQDLTNGDLATKAELAATRASNEQSYNELVDNLANDQYNTALQLKDISAQNDVLAVAQFKQRYPDAYTLLESATDSLYQILKELIKLGTFILVGNIGGSVLGGVTNGLLTAGSSGAGATGAGVASAAGVSGATALGTAGAILGGVAGIGTAGYGIYQMATADNTRDGTAAADSAATTQFNKGLTKLGTVGIGAAIGAVGGPVGAGIGAGVGALVGAILSKAQVDEYAERANRIELMGKAISDLTDASDQYSESAKQSTNVQNQIKKLNKEMKNLDKDSSAYIQAQSEMDSMLKTLEDKYGDLGVSVNDLINSTDGSIPALDAMIEKERKLAGIRADAAAAELHDGLDDIAKEMKDVQNATNTAKKKVDDYEKLTNYSEAANKAIAAGDITLDKKGKLVYNGGDKSGYGIDSDYLYNVADWMNSNLWSVSKKSGYESGHLVDSPYGGEQYEYYNMAEMIDAIVSDTSSNKKGQDLYDDYARARLAEADAANKNAANMVSILESRYKQLNSYVGDITSSDFASKFNDLSSSEQDEFKNILKSIATDYNDERFSAAKTTETETIYNKMKSALDKSGISGVKGVLATGSSYIAEEGAYLLHPEEIVLNKQDSEIYRKAITSIPDLASFIDILYSSGNGSMNNESDSTEVVTSIKSGTDTLVNAVKDLNSTVEKLINLTANIASQSNKTRYVGENRIADNYINLSANPNI